VSPSAEHDPPRRGHGDDGFSLIEIIVSLGIVLVVMSALLPQLIVGIKSTGTSRMVTQAKGVTQGQLERMRNLPFHVARDAGEYLDVLDFYYRDKVVPGTAASCLSNGKYVAPATGWSGYVAGTARCDYEPQSGPMYRYVAPPADGFTVVVDTQFLSGATPPVVVTPPNGYNTQATGTDSPAASQIGVTVTVLYADRATLRPVTTYTQIADQPAVTNRIKVSASATAVEVGSTTKADGAVSLAGGLLNLAGSLTYASTASANLVAVSAGLATGEQGAGASATLAAPPTPTLGPRVSAAGALVSGCALVCWGGSRLDLPSMSATSGLPNVGTASAPMQSLLTTNDNHGLSFDNSAPADHRPELGLTSPLVRLDSSASPSASGVTSACRPGSSGASSYVNASGFLLSTASAVEACAVSRTSTISLFPTSFAPRGVVQVELTEASVHCVVSGAGHTPTVSYDYRAVVKYHDGSAGDDAYVVAATITPALTTDPLAGIDLSTVAVGGGHKLADYVASWSSFLRADLDSTSSNGRAAVGLPGVLTLTSQPVRTGTEQLLAPDGSVLLDGVALASALSVSVGAVGCSAEDAR
jgi:prepilin-type N-terminal cleavage/methylation domain-containing protein